MTTVHSNAPIASAAPPALTPEPPQASDRTPESAQPFADVQARETSDAMPGPMSGWANEGPGVEPKETSTHWRQLAQVLRQSRQAQALQALQQRQEARELAQTYRLFSLVPVEAGIAAERDMLTKLVVAPGDELKEKERSATLDALDKMESAIAEYKKNSEAGPHTKAAEMRRIEDLGTELVDISKKLRDQLRTLKMAQEIQSLKRKVDELEKKQDPSSVFNIIRAIVNPISSLTWLPGIPKASTAERTG